ncbi:MAG: ATP-binding cassette domain-containing protein [Defluviitaleaceae bacterium]|nr:ATP-binding cassette domain-containing protein [Defluviitaleaceae bacterium]MCL2836102.1 ATP-binding cassette domain-containing protein [Defluviitaleaceae bacterium]
MAEHNDIVLDVRGLKQYFTSGFGRNKVIVKAVDGIDFKISRGQTFGLVGESGCGKTTTGRTIIRLYKPTDGDIYFNGELISKKLSYEERQKVTQGIQMIFQDPVSSLNPRMTISEIVREGLIINKLVKNNNELSKRVMDILRIVGLQEDHMTRYPHEFSGGQRQRIGIARALISNPSLIIADEPVSALDVSIQAQVLNLLNRLKKSMGLTILFIAHDLSVVKYFSDYIGVMYYGKIMEMGKPSDIYENPVHPYTRALLTAIPIPDPAYQKGRSFITYDPSVHDYSTEKPVMHDLGNGHLVYASESEIAGYKTEGIIKG